MNRISQEHFPKPITRPYSGASRQGQEPRKSERHSFFRFLGKDRLHRQSDKQKQGTCAALLVRTDKKQFRKKKQEARGRIRRLFFLSFSCGASGQPLQRANSSSSRCVVGGVAESAPPQPRYQQTHNPAAAGAPLFGATCIVVSRQRCAETLQKSPTMCRRDLDRREGYVLPYSQRWHYMLTQTSAWE